MRLESFSASPDIVGGRVWLRWNYALDPLESPADAPVALVRRKQRDYDFPPLVPGDPYLVYDSANFPPAPIPGALQVIDLPREEHIDEQGRSIRSESISVAAISGARTTEFQRRKQSVVYDTDGKPIRLSIALLDARGLTPLQPYYYMLDDGSVPDPEEIGSYRSIATPGGSYGLNLRLRDMLPENLKIHDSHPLPAASAFSGVPETLPNGGQLRRFVDVFGMGSDALRSSAEQLRLLRDPQNVEARFLDILGEMVGWETASTVPIAQQRNELQTAPRLFDVVGTVPALAALVTHQTGWRAQVAEFTQNIARSNLPPTRNLYIRREEAAGSWRGADDAAPIFNFPVGTVNGIGTAPATIVSANGEPFALRAGLDLTLTVDGGVPARVRFGPDDFVNIGAATAAEVAAVIAAAFDSVEARANAGAVELSTVAIGPLASLAIERADTSLFALNAAPDGPISAVTDGAGRVRIVYARHIHLDGRTSDENPTIDRSIAIRSWGYGSWRGEIALPDWAGATTSPAAAQLPDGRLAVAWIDLKQGAGSQLRVAAALPADATSASIVGHRAGPFALGGGTQITFVGQFGTEIFTVVPADYTVLNAATAAEVAAAINAQCPSLNATDVSGTIQISTVALGDEARLAVDLSASTAARALGLSERNIFGRGAWSAALDWPGPLAGPMAWGPVADSTLSVDPTGGMHLFWSEHLGNFWQLRQAHWSERLTLVTAQGVSQRDAAGPWVNWHMVDGLPSNAVRAVATDARAALWFATDTGIAERRSDGTWTSFDTGDGLSSNDTRSIAVLANGDIWVATPAGVSERTTAGVISVIAAAPAGLVDNDVRWVAADGEGGAWAATPNGVSLRSNGGTWRTWTVADGLPSGIPNRIATGPAGRVAVATTAGVAIRAADGWRSFTAADGLPSSDARDLVWSQDGTLYVATSAGLCWWDGKEWKSRQPADGLPVADLRSIAMLADGRLAIGTVNGLLVGPPTARAGEWEIATVADGIAGPIVVGIWGGWSAAMTIASSGGGSREPRSHVDGGGNIWLYYSQRGPIAAEAAESWSLQLRRYDPATGLWGAQSAITAPAAGVADRQPASEPDGAGIRLFFTSNRNGGSAIWQVLVDALGAPGVPALVATDMAELSRPVPFVGPDGSTWLAHRSDAPVAHAQVAVIAEPGAGARASMRVPPVQALTLNAGSRTPVFKHASRNLGRRRWGDYFTYTPEYPHLIDDDVPNQTHIYTRRTIGLYLRQSPIGVAITSEAIARLRQLLRRHLPINLRLALVVAPDPLIEFVYDPGADIQDFWSDDMPFVETLGGISDASNAAMPDISVLIANELASRSFDAGLLATLRRRTWFPDLV